MSKIRLINSMFVTLILLFPTFLSAGTIQLPQTGQTKCYDTAGTEIPCTGTGQDGEIRAGVAWPEPRFTVTYCDANGPCSDQSSDCDGNPSTDVVTDKLTGLMWARNGNLPVGERTWFRALDYSNNLFLCGYSDWRLPNVIELQSILNANEPYSYTYLNSHGFWDVQYYYYWTSTTDVSHDYAWVVDMSSGHVRSGNKDTTGDSWVFFFTWPVRSGQSGFISLPQTGQNIGYSAGDDGDLRQGATWPNPRFIDNSKGTVTDNLTGLVWLKDANCIRTKYPSFDNYMNSGDGAVSWQNAIDFIIGMNSDTYSDCNGGHKDWRLPNRKELSSLVDYSNYNTALPTGHPFVNVQSDFYWSSTSNVAFNGAWIVHMWNGGVDINYKDAANPYGYGYVWPVRGGQGEPPPPPPPSYGNLEVSPSSHDFGEVKVGECDLQLFSLKNTGNTDLNVSDISLSDTTNFSFDNTIIYACSTNGQSLKPNDSCNVVISFCPSNSGSFNENLIVKSNDPDTSTFNVSLTGIAKTNILFSEYKPTLVVKQKVDALKFTSFSGIVKRINSVDASDEKLNFLEKELAKANLFPISNTVKICSKGSEIDWNKIKVIVNGKDVPADKLGIYDFPPSSDCNSSGLIEFRMYQLKGDVNIKVVAQSLDGVIAMAQWTYLVDTEWFWPTAWDIIGKLPSGPILDTLKKIIDFFEGLFMPIPLSPA